MDQVDRQNWPSSLAERHRPTRYADVVGQVSAIASLREEALLRRGRSVLLFGPPGCGKTVLAEIYARALLCQRGSGEPCGSDTCHDCAESGWGGQHPNWRRWRRQMDDVAGSVRQINDAVDDEFWGGGWLVVSLDAADRLSEQAFDALHERMERQPPRATFILTTTKPEAIPERTHQLLRPVPVVPLSGPERLVLIDRVRGCVPDEADARALLVSLGINSARALLRDLELIAGDGPLRLEAVRAFYGLTDVDPVERYLGKLLARCSFNAQLDVLDDWDATPSTKIAGIEAKFAELFDAELRRAIRPTDAKRAALLTELRARAQALQLTPRSLYAAILSFWRPAASVSAGELLARASAFDEYLNGPGGAMIAQPGLSVPLRKRRNERNIAARPKASKDLPRQEGSTSAHYLSRRQVRDLWEAGSFLVQVHGLCLNARLSLDHAALELTPEAVGPWLSQVLHELGMRVSERCASAGAREILHYLYVHENQPSGGYTHVFASIPEAAGDVRAWLRRRSAQIQPSSKADDGLRFRYWPGNAVTPERMRRHLRLMALVCRGCNPTEPRHPKSRTSTSLIDCLGVPIHLRRKIGRRTGAQRCGVSRQIGPVARRAANADLSVLSAFRPGAPNALTTEWEAHEHAYRTGLNKARSEARARLDEEWPESSDALAAAVRRAQLMALEKGWRESRQLREEQRPGFGSVPHLPNMF